MLSRLKDHLLKDDSTLVILRQVCRAMYRANSDNVKFIKCINKNLMFAEYIQAALGRADYKVVENGTHMATVEGLRGVIAIGDTIEECRQDLIEVIDGWVALRLRMGDSIPPIDGATIDVSAEPMAVV